MKNKFRPATKEERWADRERFKFDHCGCPIDSWDGPDAVISVPGLVCELNRYRNLLNDRRAQADRQALIIRWAAEQPCVSYRVNAYCEICGDIKEHVNYKGIVATCQSCYTNIQWHCGQCPPCLARAEVK